MIGPWDRIEGSSRDDELDAGVEARVADPLWMLARQWQVGEFRGDDAGNPIAARMEWQATALRSYRPGDEGTFVPMPTMQPLERVVEAAPPPTSGAARLHWSSRLAAQLSRRLLRDGHGDAVAALAEADAFELPAGDAVALPGAGSTAAELLRRRSFDGAALLDADAATIGAALAGLPATSRDEVLGTIERWQDATKARFATPPRDTWDDTRLEHCFSLTAGTGDSEVVITATEYAGGHLDWYSFDVERPRGGAGTKPPDIDVPPVVDIPPIVVPRPAEKVTAIPTPVRYAGMPASRWWAFEEGDVHFGDIAAAPGDLGRLLLADYVTVYGNDWYSIPLASPAGHRVPGPRPEGVRHDGRRVYFDRPCRAGRRAPARPTSVPVVRAERRPVGEGGRGPAASPATVAVGRSGRSDARTRRTRPRRSRQPGLGDRAIRRGADRPCRRSAPALAHGDAARFGTPATTSNVSSRSWRDDLQPPPKDGQGLPLPPIELPPDRPKPTDDEDYTPTSELWRYRLESTAPPFWVPFVPRRIGNGAQFRLRRARMQEWELLDRSVTGAKGELLQPRQPMMIEEEEVPRGGATLERRWQTARWTDGSLHVWLQRTKRLGHGERSSGLRWDSLEDLPDAGDHP